MSIDSEATTEPNSMDLDGEHSSLYEGKSRTGNVLAQSEELTVTLLAHLPVEVLQVLRNTGAK